MLEGSRFVCMCMVRGKGDILFQALGAGGFLVGQGVGGALFSNTEWGQTIVHASLTYI